MNEFLSCCYCSLNTQKLHCKHWHSWNLKLWIFQFTHLIYFKYLAPKVSASNVWSLWCPKKERDRGRDLECGKLLYKAIMRRIIRLYTTSQWVFTSISNLICSLSYYAKFYHYLGKYLSHQYQADPYNAKDRFRTIYQLIIFFIFQKN